jgi:hypothetical protein
MMYLMEKKVETLCFNDYPIFSTSYLPNFFNYNGEEKS